MDALVEEFDKKLCIKAIISFPDGEVGYVYEDSKEVLINKIHEKILSIEDNRIVLLKEKEVIQWLFDDTSFLPGISEFSSKAKDIEKKKVLEDKWGRAILKKRRPDLKLDGQWTNNFGQHICEEYLLLINKSIIKPIIKEGKQPDLETDDSIIEVKTCTYFTTGTANEKILGVPFKYANVPMLYGKRLKIFCLGGAEKASKTQYGNLLGEKTNPVQRAMLEYFSSLQIDYYAFSELLKELI